MSTFRFKILNVFVKMNNVFIVSAIAGVLFNRNNYVIPRFRGVTIESETQVANQRTAVVASQSLGFDEMVDDFANNLSAVKFAYNA